MTNTSRMMSLSLSCAQRGWSMICFTTGPIGPSPVREGDGGEGERGEKRKGERVCERECVRESESDGERERWRE